MRDDQSSPCALLLHGQPGSSADWNQVLEHLQGLRVLVPDRPGYDGTPAGGFARNAAALGPLLQRRAAGSTVLVGHSWGAGVALQLALEHPDVVSGVCLVAPVGSPLAVTSLDRVLALPVLRRLAGEVVCAAAALAPGSVAGSTGSTLGPDQRRQVRASGRLWARSGAARSWAREQTALVRESPSLAARLAGVTAPCVVLHGRQDRSISVAAAVDLVARLPRARLQLVDGGHLLPLEAPATVAAAVRQLLASTNP